MTEYQARAQSNTDVIDHRSSLSITIEDMVAEGWEIVSIQTGMTSPYGGPSVWYYTVVFKKDLEPTTDN